MSDIIKEAREALEGVTPGPWSVGKHAVGVRGATGMDRLLFETLWHDEQGKTDMRFIAWAREGVPALIARAEAAEAALTAERAKVAKLVEAAAWAFRHVKHMPMDEASQADFARHLAAITAARGE